LSLGIAVFSTPPIPTEAPTQTPTETPVAIPTSSPTMVPSSSPSQMPSDVPVTAFSPLGEKIIVKDDILLFSGNVSFEFLNFLFFRFLLI